MAREERCWLRACAILYQGECWQGRTREGEGGLKMVLPANRCSNVGAGMYLCTHTHTDNNNSSSLPPSLHPPTHPPLGNVVLLKCTRRGDRGRVQRVAEHQVQMVRACRGRQAAGAAHHAAHPVCTKQARGATSTAIPATGLGHPWLQLISPSHPTPRSPLRRRPPSGMTTATRSFACDMLASTPPPLHGSSRPLEKTMLEAAPSRLPPHCGRGAATAAGTAAGRRAGSEGGGGVEWQAQRWCRVALARTWTHSQGISRPEMFEPAACAPDLDGCP